MHGYVCLCLSSVCIFWNPIMEIKEVLETEEGIQAGEAGLRLCFLSCYTQAWVAPGLSGGPKQLMCWWSLQSSCSVNTEAAGRESVRFCSGLASGRALSLSYTHPHVPTHTDTLKKAPACQHPGPSSTITLSLQRLPSPWQRAFVGTTDRHSHYCG